MNKENVAWRGYMRHRTLKKEMWWHAKTQMNQEGTVLSRKDKHDSTYVWNLEWSTSARQKVAGWYMLRVRGLNPTEYLPIGRGKDFWDCMLFKLAQ